MGYAESGDIIERTGGNGAQGVRQVGGRYFRPARAVALLRGKHRKTSQTTWTARSRLTTTCAWLPPEGPPPSEEQITAAWGRLVSRQHLTEEQQKLVMQSLLTYKDVVFSEEIGKTDLLTHHPFEA